MARVDAEWRAVLTEAFTQALEEYGVEERFPASAIVPLVMTFAQGLALERLSGIREGHAALLAWIHDWLASLEAGAAAKRATRRSPPRRRRISR